MNKYHNQKTKTSDGIVHDSQKEANRWVELNLLQRAGKITDLKRQVKYILIPAQYERSDKLDKYGVPKRGKLLERECSYIADFVYRENGRVIVEDTKGLKTKEYIIKRKILLAHYGICIREV